MLLFFQSLLPSLAWRCVITHGAAATATVASASLADIDWDLTNSTVSASYAAGQLWVVTTTNLSSQVTSNSSSAPDFNAVRSFSISGSFSNAALRITLLCKSSSSLLA